MKTVEIRGKTDSELEYELKQLEKELFDRRFRSAADSGVDPSRIRQVRRTIARIHTIRHERASQIRGQEPR
jgi:large subunit ribosomal protein L29